MLPFFVLEFSPAGNSEAHSEKRRALRIDVKNAGQTTIATKPSAFLARESKGNF